jgi:hypothetical protein
MNYYGSRQVADGPNEGRWHYTCRNDGRIWPVGYCSSIQTCPNAEQSSFCQIDCQLCHGKRYVDVDEPCPGHDTAEEAAEHCRQYVLDTATYDHEFQSAERCEADGCECWTAGAARTGHPQRQDVFLCDEHRNRETLEQLVQAPGEIISS